MEQINHQNIEYNLLKDIFITPFEISKLEQPFKFNKEKIEFLLDDDGYTKNIFYILDSEGNIKKEQNNISDYKLKKVDGFFNAIKKENPKRKR